MKATRAAKDARRAHRSAKHRRKRDDGPRLTPLGGVMEPELVAQILAAIGEIDVEGGWEELSPRILPVLKRVRYPYPPDLAPLLLQVPPGIWTGFGIDLGPAFTHVTPERLAAWGVDRATLLATALDNLRRLTETEPPVIQRFAFEGLGLIAVQGQGWGSALLLLPDVLRPILGPEPRILLAPVRNTIVALPEDVEADVGIGVWHALAEGAHDELAVDPLRWTGSSVVGLDDDALGLPN